MENQVHPVEIENEVEQIAQPEHTVIKGSCPTCRSGIDPTIGTGDFQAALHDSL
jgi:hypothetical protein